MLLTFMQTTNNQNRFFFVQLNFFTSNGKRSIKPLFESVTSFENRWEQKIQQGPQFWKLVLQWSLKKNCGKNIIKRWWKLSHFSLSLICKTFIQCLYYNCAPSVFLQHVNIKTLEKIIRMVNVRSKMNQYILWGTWLNCLY